MVSRSSDRVQSTTNMTKLRVYICMLTISLLAFVHQSTQEAYVIENTQHSDYPGYCYSKDPYSNETFMIKVDTKKRRPQKCYSVECASDYRLIILGCGARANVEHCRVIRGDLSKPYPYCCDEFIC